jgi:integrase
MGRSLPCNLNQILFSSPPYALPIQARSPHPDEANHLASVCETPVERLIIWTLLDTGLRVSELAGLTREHIDWQNHRRERCQSYAEMADNR